jgi:hypothetical protein
MASGLPKELEEFPQPLRHLVLAELAAGNEIGELRSGFPAPPIGACLELARPMCTHPRVSSERLVYQEFKAVGYPGGFSDPRGHFFVLDPRQLAQSEPDMAALRAAKEDAVRREDARRWGQSATENASPHEADKGDRMQTRESDAPSQGKAHAGLPGAGSPLIEAFLAGLTPSHASWRDGQGCDLALLANANPKEREQLEHLLLSRGVSGWREAQALYALNTPAARACLQQAFARAVQRADAALQIALLGQAGDCFAEEEKNAALCLGLSTLPLYGGLSQALLLAEDYPSREIVEVLKAGVLGRELVIARSFAATLLAIFGGAESPEDEVLLPFLQRIHELPREEFHRQLLACLDQAPRAKLWH